MDTNNLASSVEEEIQAHNGLRVGEYILQEKIGEGGFGEVWKGRHHLLKDQWGAVKILKASYGSEILEKEARVHYELQKILEKEKKSEFLTRLMGGDPFHNPPYLIREYIHPDGTGRISLREYLKEDLSWKEEIFTQLLEVLSIAHSNGLVHGDLKPENILIEKGKIKITDFGLGRLLPTDKANLSRSLKESSANVVGTLAYMSPEQKEGKGPDKASDVYSLGIILYELMTGELPHGRANPSQINSKVSKEIDQIFDRCYNHKDFRYKSIPEIKEDWDRIYLSKNSTPSFQAQILSPEESKHLMAKTVEIKASEQGTVANQKAEDLEKEPATLGFFRRFLAFGVDLITLSLAFYAIRPAFEFPNKGSMFVTFFIFTSIYFVFTTCILGGTLGKLSLGMKVVNKEGGKLSLPASMGRYLGYFISFFFFGFGFYMIGFHEEHRGLHDFLGRSWVVEDK